VLSPLHRSTGSFASSCFHCGEEEEEEEEEEAAAAADKITTYVRISLTCRLIIAFIEKSPVCDDFTETDSGRGRHAFI